jgi:cytochrome P450
MFFATIFVLLIVFLATAYWYLKWYYSAISKHAKKLPGLEPLWMSGNLKNSGISTGRVAPHEALAEFKEKYGDIYSFWYGSLRAVVISRIDHVRHVLKNREIYDQSTKTISTFGVLFPTGLFVVRGDTWKRHARIILPSFKRVKVLPYLDATVKCVDRLIDKHYVKYDGQIHTDVVVQCQDCLLNLITLITFGYDLETSTEIDVANLRQAFHDFAQYANEFLMSGGIPNWIGKLILMLHWKFQRASRTIKKSVIHIVTEAQKWQQDKSASSNKLRSLLVSLIASVKDESSSEKAALTNNEVFDEAGMSIMAGFETTSNALAWFIFNMSKNPNVQRKIKEELKEHNVTHETSLTHEIVDSLDYVECVTKEVLRLAPIAPDISREATCDDMIDGIPIKKGDVIVIAIQNLHKDPRYWKIDPTKFLPERFLDEDKNPPQYAYLPFGGGHRVCPAQDLAFFELKIAITRLMQRVTFEDPGDEANNSGGFLQIITCIPKHMAVRVRVDFDKETS